MAHIGNGVSHAAFCRSASVNGGSAVTVISDRVERIDGLSVVKSLPKLFFEKKSPELKNAPRLVNR